MLLPASLLPSLISLLPLPSLARRKCYRVEYLVENEHMMCVSACSPGAVRRLVVYVPQEHDMTVVRNLDGRLPFRIAERERQRG